MAVAAVQPPVVLAAPRALQGASVASAGREVWQRACVQALLRGMRSPSSVSVCAVSFPQNKGTRRACYHAIRTMHTRHLELVAGAGEKRGAPATVWDGLLGCCVPCRRVREQQPDGSQAPTRVRRQEPAAGGPAEDVPEWAEARPQPYISIFDPYDAIFPLHHYFITPGRRAKRSTASPAKSRSIPQSLAHALAVVLPSERASGAPVRRVRV